MAKAKKSKRRSRTGWGRFVQDNASVAAEKAKADGSDESYFAVLSEWWKEAADEIKDNYAKDKTFVHKIEIKVPESKSSEESSI